MAGRTNIDTAIVNVGKTTTPVTAGTAAIAFAATDNTNGNTVTLNGTEIVLFKNTEVADAKTVTLTMRTDAYGRSGVVTTYSIAAGAVAIFRPQPVEVWGQVTTNYLHIDTSAASVHFAVLRLT